jgi:hypothetical protein
MLRREVSILARRSEEAVVSVNGHKVPASDNSEMRFFSNMRKNPTLIDTRFDRLQSQ